jgi:hypothetical protein
MYTDHTVQALHFVRVWVYSLNAEDNPDPDWFGQTYNAIYNYLTQLPLYSEEEHRYRRLDKTWGSYAPGLKR